MRDFIELIDEYPKIFISIAGFIIWIITIIKEKD